MNEGSHGNRVIPYGGTPAFGAEPSALIFDHLHKCAGTTFRYQLASRFESFYDASFLEAWVRDHQAIWQSTAPQIAIAGHAALGMHELLPRHYNAYYITVLREPYARALSEHRFLRDWYYPVQPLADYLRQMQPNYLVQRLGNGSLDLAMDRLESFYHIFGLTERFDDFLAHLGVVTNLDFSAYQNRNRSNASKEKPPASLRDEFAERNALDLELYAVAVDLFDSRFHATSSLNRAPQRVAAIPPDEHIPTASGITRLIDHRQFGDAARRVDALGSRDEAERLQLLFSSSMLHLAAGCPRDALARAHTATQISAERAIAEASILQAINAAEARVVLENAIAHFQSIVTVQPDSQLNRFRESVRQALMQLDETFRASMWQWDPGAFLHGRWVIMRLAALALAIAAKPVRVALYGNGRHTQWLLALLRQLPLHISVTMILDDNAGASNSSALGHGAVKVFRPDASLVRDFDLIIPSSDSVEHLMRQRCNEVFPGNVPVYSLYEGFPFPPGPYAKSDPTLPRLSLVTVTPHEGCAMSISWQAQVQAQYYPNLEHVTAVAAGSAVPTDELLPWTREVSIPAATGYVDALRAALFHATGEWVCLANPEDSLAPGALVALGRQTADADVVIGATRLIRNGTCVDVITPRSALPDALLAWWHHDMMPPSANAMFFRRVAILEAMAVIPGDLPPAAVRYELLLRMAKRHGAVTIMKEVLASSEAAVHPLEQTQAAAIAQRHDGILDPVARTRHRQLDFLLSGTSDDFIVAQKMLPRPAGEDLPPISIITPSFNARPYLARACYSVAMQCYPKVEHVVIDGASTDGTQSLFSHFPIRALSEPDHGMYEAINKGIRLASHRHIIVLSSDDFLEPGALQAIGKFLRGHPDTPFVAGGLRVITTDRRVTFNSAASDRLSNLLRWWRPNAYPYNTVAYVFTREHWEAVGGFDATLRVAADADFVMKSRRHAPFARLPDIFGTWDMRPECLTMQARTGLGRDELKIVVGRHIDALGRCERKQFLAEQEAVLCAS